MKFSLLSFNIHKGFSLFERSFTLPRIRDFIRELNPDLALLQEVVGENTKHRSRLPQWPTVSQTEYLSKGNWPHSVYGKNAIYEKPPHYRNHGNCLLSRFSILSSENQNISTNSLEQRGLLHAKVQIPQGPALHLFNVHLNLTHKGRMQQIQKIIERGKIHVDPTSPLILAGDFNDWNQKTAAPLAEHLELEESFHHMQSRHASSFPSFFPVLSLDRIYYRGLHIVSSRVINEKSTQALSDHLPLLVEFETEVPK